MKIEFINHSSILVSDDTVKLMCDFWKSGRAFNEGWELLSDTPFDYGDFSRVTHLWFSHEHPDHFSPGDIMKIPAELRAVITVLFQKTADKRVVGFCRKAGFKEVIELEPGLPFRLGEDCVVTCMPFGAEWGDVDSWLLIQMGDKKLLNLNDCEVHKASQAATIREICGEIDVLAAQFSYAARQGNPGDIARYERSHCAHLDYFAVKVEALRPKVALPFSSFVNWCSEDNWYLNDGIVRVAEIVEQTRRDGLAEPLVMFPGDVWEVGAPIDNASALLRYESAYESLSGRTPLPSTLVPMEQLIAAGQKLVAPLADPVRSGRVRRYLAMKQFDTVERDKYPVFLLRAINKMAAVARQRISPVSIFVSDLGLCFELTLDHGLQLAEMAPEQCDLSIKSHALHHCLATGFGGETLQVNGRFVEQKKGGWSKLFQICYLARRVEQKREIPPAIAPAFLRRPA